MIRMISSSPWPSAVCTTARTKTPLISPMVSHRSSVRQSSGKVTAYGSAKTSVASSKLTPCFVLLARLLRASHSKRIRVCNCAAYLLASRVYCTYSIVHTKGHVERLAGQFKRRSRSLTSFRLTAKGKETEDPPLRTARVGASAKAKEPARRRRYAHSKSGCAIKPRTRKTKAKRDPSRFARSRWQRTTGAAEATMKGCAAEAVP